MTSEEPEGSDCGEVFYRGWSKGSETTGVILVHLCIEEDGEVTRAAVTLPGAFPVPPTAVSSLGGLGTLGVWVTLSSSSRPTAVVETVTLWGSVVFREGVDFEAIGLQVRLDQWVVVLMAGVVVVMVAAEDLLLEEEAGVAVEVK